MELNSVQEDALIELLNIGFGRAAASLSQLTGHRVILEVPHVRIHPVSALPEMLGQVIQSDVASVHQIFSGPVARGRAADPRSAGRGDPQGTADRRARAAPLHRRLRAGSDHGNRQYPPQRMPRHVRQPAEGPGFLLGPAAQPGERDGDPEHAAGRPGRRAVRPGGPRRVQAAGSRSARVISSSF